MYLMKLFQAVSHFTVFSQRSVYVFSLPFILVHTFGNIIQKSLNKIFNIALIYESIEIFECSSVLVHS